jgi:hypothetical protein
VARNGIEAPGLESGLVSVTRRSVGLILVAPVLLAACEFGYNPTQSAEPSSYVACAEAFHRAAGASATADRLSDLYPAVRECRTAADWAAAFESVDGAGLSGTALSVLRNICLADAVKNEPLCAELPAN